VLAAGVSIPDIMAREGVHPETPPVPFTPGWDLVGEVDRLGNGVSGVEPGQIVAAMPIHGAYAEFVCLPQPELVPVPPGLDAAEAVSVILNYITAYQMLHRSAKVKPGQSVLFHGASGGVGTALLQLGRLAKLEMYGTCSSRGAPTVSELGGVPIDYRNQDYVKEIHRLTGDGVDAVFDPIGGAHLRHSSEALGRGGTVVGYGNTTSLRGEGLGKDRTGRRNRLHGIPIYALYIAGGWLLPGRKRIVPYGIQTLKLLPIDLQGARAAIEARKRNERWRATFCAQDPVPNAPSSNVTRCTLGLANRRDAVVAHAVSIAETCPTVRAFRAEPAAAIDVRLRPVRDAVDA